MYRKRRQLLKHKQLAKKRRTEQEEVQGFPPMAPPVVPTQEVDSDGEPITWQDEDSWETDNSADNPTGDPNVEPQSPLSEEEDWEDFKALKLVDDEGEMRLQTNPDFMEAEEEAKGGPQREVWKGDSRRLKPDEELVFENKAYDVFYRTSVEWPCLSLDLLSDGSTPDPKAFPYSVGVVSGSQAADGKNVVYFLKFSELYKTKNDDPSSSESEDDLNNSDLDGGDPVLESYTFQHQGATNRIRFWDTRRCVATWNDQGTVQIFDGAQYVNKLFHEKWATLPTAQ